MSEYYLADVRARERVGKRDREHTASDARQEQEMKVTLLGDFLFPSTEPEGCDPYNATNGKSAREVWRTRRDRR